MNILGLMSGSSLDGLDMALCSISGDEYNEDISCRVLKAESSEFPKKILDKLMKVKELSSKELIKFDAEFDGVIN